MTGILKKKLRQGGKEPPAPLKTTKRHTFCLNMNLRYNLGENKVTSLLKSFF